MREVGKAVGALMIIMFLFPLLVILIVLGSDSISLTGNSQLETCLPQLLVREIDGEMNMETIKAQAVLLRSNLTKALQEDSLSFSDLYKKIMDENELGASGQAADQIDKKIEKACQDTKGWVVTYEDQVCYCPYFLCSSGVTRDSFVVLEDKGYPYVISVPSHKDEECSAYTNTFYYEKKEWYQRIIEVFPNCGLNEEQMETGIQIVETDEAGYVLWLQVGSQMVGGEEFRSLMKLSSACFLMEYSQDQIRITCKGVGHGFGFSQCGADAMAKEGKTWKELIEFYFQNIKIEKRE